MVASSSADVYSPFQPTMLPEEGPQSSEEGSGLHSPVFGAPYPTHGDSFRYQHDHHLDVHHSASGMIPPPPPPQYDYSLHTHQQPPILDTLELPGSGGGGARQHVTFPGGGGGGGSQHHHHHYPVPPRSSNHLGIDFSPQSSRSIPSPATHAHAHAHAHSHSHGGPAIDFRYSSSSSSPAERRLPGGSSHEQAYTRPSGNSAIVPMDSDHRSSLVPSSSARSDISPTAEASTSPREPRKEISSVVIACRQCRSRKIRCDSTRPVCNNCVRRSNECQYDLVPKRRGPDKRPGTRQRSCKKRPLDGSAPPPPKRKRTSAAASEWSTEQQQQQQQQQRELPPLPSSSSSSSARVKENMNVNMQDSAKRPSPSSRQGDRHPQDPHYPHLHPHQHQHQQQHQHQHQHQHTQPPSPTDLRLPTDHPDAHFKHDPSSTTTSTATATTRRNPSSSSSSYMYGQGSYTKPSYPRQLDVNTLQFPDPIHRSSHTSTSQHHGHVPTSPSIEFGSKPWWDKIMATHSPENLATELTFLYNNTGHLLSFVNLNYFIKRLYHADERVQIQPAFMLAVLAMAKLMVSSSIELGVEGVRSALGYLADAHTALRQSMDNGWRDYNLAEAALILALFESSAYPHHSPEHARNALITLDDLIKSLSLTTIDASDPDVNRFSENQVPVVLLEGAECPTSCGCFPPGSIDPPDPYHNRPYILPWDSTWSVEQIRAEEIRRLCWSSLTLVSEYVAQCEAFNELPPDFFLCEPSNFGLLYPGEVLDRVSPYYRGDQSLTTKESVWALYCRSMLLWNFCNRFRVGSQEEERSEQVHEAFTEAQSIEESLNAHRCNLDTSLIYTCREYIHNTRMLVAQALRSFQGIEDRKSGPGPIFNRKQAEDWLFYVDQIIRRVNSLIHSLNSPEGYQLTRRPFRINWFINQLTICLYLWTNDPTLDDALKLAKNILNPIDVLNRLWSCSAIQNKCDSLRQQLEAACNSRDMEGPFSPNYSVPAFVRSS